MNTLMKTQLIEALLSNEKIEKSILEEYYNQFAEDVFKLLRENTDTIKSAFTLGFTHIELSALLDDLATDEAGKKYTHQNYLRSKSTENCRACA